MYKVKIKNKNTRRKTTREHMEFPDQTDLDGMVAVFTAELLDQKDYIFYSFDIYYSLSGTEA